MDHGCAKNYATISCQEEDGNGQYLLAGSFWTKVVKNIDAKTNGGAGANKQKERTPRILLG